MMHMYIAYEVSTHGSLVDMYYNQQGFSNDDFTFINKTFNFNGILKPYRIGIFNGSAIRLVNSSKYKFNIV